MTSPKKIRYLLFSLLIFELLSGIQWGVHRGLSSLFAKQILSINSFTQIGVIVSIFGVSKAITNLVFGAMRARMVSDIAPQETEGTLIGSYRFFRDMGYFFGPILLGRIADVYKLDYAFYITSAIVMIAFLALVFFLEETNPKTR